MQAITGATGTSRAVQQFLDRDIRTFLEVMREHGDAAPAGGPATDTPVMGGEEGTDG